MQTLVACCSFFYLFESFCFDLRNTARSKFEPANMQTDGCPTNHQELSEQLKLMTFTITNILRFSFVKFMHLFIYSHY